MAANQSVEDLARLGNSKDWVEAIKLLNGFKNDENHYFVTYKKENDSNEHEFQFNKVTKVDDETYLVAFHKEDYDRGIRYYTGEDIKLDRFEIVNVQIVDPSTYDIVVFTD
ncbi:hypothetical protein NC661_01890 [Aquibacillus koreensis]|uniref:Uncharacterized protein n=1 Tax=Aquibacillus koreensis TaxID=279446 RepID=A0A9X3WKP0_9BACI|nr:hypothetical protein [Aquibacillus koreensis]MCT2537980.1 hypothetical protein [Aquibacillus koreensis]MDC3419129.1 hypothetical protein [Aquibacillus koreensis]